MNDLALGGIVATLAAVPLSLLLLAFTDVIHLPEAGQRHRWISRCLAALALPLALVLGVLVWGWAGAAHLGPLCAAFATPEIRTTTPLTLRSLLIDSDQRGPPAWAAALLKSGGGSLEFLEYAPSRSPAALAQPAASSPETAPLQSTHVLQVRRVTHHRNRWFHVEMDRFRLLERTTGAALAEGDELWIRAGRATYHCGIGSGARPTSATAWPGGGGVARFVQAALRPRRPS